MSSANPKLHTACGAVIWRKTGLKLQIIHDFALLQECRNARSRCNNGVGGGGWGHTVVHHPTPVNPRHPSLSSPFPCSTSSPPSFRSRSFSPADDNLLSRLWIVFHQVKPFAKGGVAAVHCLLSSPEAFDCTRGASSVTPLATAGAGGTHTAPARYQYRVGERYGGGGRGGVMITM